MVVVVSGVVLSDVLLSTLCLVYLPDMDYRTNSALDFWGTDLSPGSCVGLCFSLVFPRA